MQHYCTFKEWGDVPHVDAAGLHELSQGDLQEEDGDSSHEDDQQVGDQEDACGDGEQASGPRVDQSPAGSGSAVRKARCSESSSSCHHQGAQTNVHLTKSAGNL